MKFMLSVLSIFAISLIFIFVGLKPSESQNVVANAEYLRVHIRANSNSEDDQNVKYMVRDAVVEALIPYLSNVITKSEAQKVIESKFDYIENVANAVLKQNGFSYTSHARISTEYFPTRSYENLTLSSGFYDSLILDLGCGQGNNWWCVIYPAFCFLKSKNSGNQVYISKIWEIINSVTNK